MEPTFAGFPLLPEITSKAAVKPTVQVTQAPKAFGRSRNSPASQSGNYASRRSCGVKDEPRFRFVISSNSFLEFLFWKTDAMLAFTLRREREAQELAVPGAIHGTLHLVLTFSRSRLVCSQEVTLCRTRSPARWLRT